MDERIISITVALSDKLGGTIRATSEGRVNLLEAAIMVFDGSHDAAAIITKGVEDPEQQNGIFGTIQPCVVDGVRSLWVTPTILRGVCNSQPMAFAFPQIRSSVRSARIQTIVRAVESVMSCSHKAAVKARPGDVNYPAPQPVAPAPQPVAPAPKVVEPAAQTHEPHIPTVREYAQQIRRANMGIATPKEPKQEPTPSVADKQSKVPATEGKVPGKSVTVPSNTANALNTKGKGPDTSATELGTAGTHTSISPADKVRAESALEQVQRILGLRTKKGYRNIEHEDYYESVTVLINNIPLTMCKKRDTDELYVMHTDAMNITGIAYHNLCKQVNSDQDISRTKVYTVRRSTNSVSRRVPCIIIPASICHKVGLIAINRGLDTLNRVVANSLAENGETLLKYLHSWGLYWSKGEHITEYEEHEVMLCKLLGVPRSHIGVLTHSEPRTDAANNSPAVATDEPMPETTANAFLLYAAVNQALLHYAAPTRAHDVAVTQVLRKTGVDLASICQGMLK